MMQRKLSFIMAVALAAICLFGCEVEETPVNGDKPKDVNHWIEGIMRTHYLWYDQLPVSPNYSLEPDAFFNSLLSREDGKMREGGMQHYSTIEKANGTKANLANGFSFGFEFKYYHVTKRDEYALRVLYVLPESPAAKAGLKRDDWIYTINNNNLPSDGMQIKSMMHATTSQTLSFGVAKGPYDAITHTATITSRQVEDNPVFMHKTLSVNGRSVGYLLYNHFTSGPGEEGVDETYNNKLRDAFQEFENVTDFVLDLRYNGGGLISCAQLLATMLAPESALDDVFCHLIYNGQKGAYPSRTLYLDRDLIKRGTGGANLNLKRLFVITSEWTASASEAVMNCLSPYLGKKQIIQIGEKTDGKNVGSVTFQDNKYEWKLHPIVSRIDNKDNKSDYANGFIPTYVCDDTYETVFYEFGDTKEYMLRRALNYIQYGVFELRSDSESLRSDTPDLIPGFSSLDFKQNRGAILPDFNE